MKNKAWIFAAGTLLAFVVLGGLLDVLLPLTGLDRWLLWGGMVVLGAGAAVLVYLHFAPRTKATAPAATGLGPEGDVDLPLSAARKRLAASGIGKGRIDRLPLVLVLGPSGSTKTTSVVQSGLAPDLLAGEGNAGDTVAPTRTVNVWYAGQGVILEAGGGLLEDATRWQRLLHHLRPSRLAAALGRSRQAPRQAVVCFSCEELIRPGAMDAVPAAAKQIRARLAEASQQLGIRLPVYVLFTKADRIPHFEDYVRSLSREEAQEVLGATLPLADLAPGTYADVQSGRIRNAFQGIFRSLSQWRLQLLPRESREQARTGAYEFPREMLKVATLAEQFLVELCRPSQLGVNPFLRGFYFAGVRPVVVSDAAPAATPAAQGRISLGATGVFNAHSLHQPAAPVSTPASSRRVPEWTFLRHVFGDIVQRDGAAMELTGGGARVDFLRRTLIASAAVVLLLLSAAFTTSYLNNRALAADGIAALRGVEPVRAAVGELPPLDALRRLDALRSVTARVGGYERSGHPWKLGWGMYTGPDVFPELRQVYFDRFAQLLWDGAQADLVGSLAAIPDTARDAAQYGTTYDALKAYLITTSHPQESSAEFLSPVLLRHWRLAGELDPERRELVRRQLDFFAEELRFGNPYAVAPDEPTVVRARGFLHRFTGTEPLYRALLAEASREGTPVRFHQEYPGAEAVVRNPFVVPAAFSRNGWTQVQEALDNVDRLLAREDWVVGERSVVPAADRARIAQELRARYVAEYVATWREYLRSGTVVPFGGPEDAARKLDVLSGNESPLLGMLALAAAHTGVDTVVVAKAFQPVHAIASGEGGRLVSESNAPYVGALGELRTAMGQVASATGPARMDALAQASSSAEQVNMQVRQIAQGFSLVGDAREVGMSVQRLLQAPTSGVQSLARALPSAEANAGGAAFCRPIRQLAAKYPFNPRAATEANMEEVAEVLQPGNSALWAFYDQALQELLVQQGSRYAPRVGADPQPTAAFVSFFNRAAGISAGLFPREGAGPQVSFALRPQTSDAVPEVRVAVDGPQQTFTRTLAAAKTFTWDGTRSRSARISARVNGAEVTVAEASGPWAAFRVLQAAEWEPAGSGRYLLRWKLPADAGVLTADLTFAGGTPVMAPGYLGLDCVSQIVR